MGAKTWTAKDIEHLAQNYGSKPNSKLAIELEKTIGAVKAKARKMGYVGPRKIGIKKYSCNETYFGSGNLQACYWAGFIAADGAIITKTNSLVIELAKKDKDQLFRFKNHVEFTGPIKVYRSKAKIALHGSKTILEDLNVIYNIPLGPKTYSLKPPTNLKSLKALAYIAGYIDGDGFVGYQSQTIKGKIYSYRKIHLIGTFGVLYWIQKMIQTILGIKKMPKISKVSSTRTCWQFALVGNNASKLEKEIQKLPIEKMSRKWRKALE